MESFEKKLNPKAISFSALVNAFLLIIAVLFYVFTKTPNLLAVILASIIAFVNPIQGYALLRPNEKKVTIARIIATVVSLSVIIAVIYSVYHLYTIGFTPVIVNPGYALIGLLIVMIVGYISNIIAEKLGGDLFWRPARSISEDYISIVYVSAFGMIGPGIAFFGVYSFDSLLGAITILLVFMPIRGKIRDMRNIAKSEELSKALEGDAKKLLDQFIPIKKILGIKAYIVASFSALTLNLELSPLVKNRVEELLENISTVLIDALGIIGVEIKYKLTMEAEIKIAVPINSEGKVEAFPSVKYLIYDIVLPSKEIKNKTEVDVGEADSLLELAQKIIPKRVDVVISKALSREAKNLLKGWFIMPVEAEIDDPESAIKALLSEL